MYATDSQHRQAGKLSAEAHVMLHDTACRASHSETQSVVLTSVFTTVLQQLEAGFTMSLPGYK